MRLNAIAVTALAAIPATLAFAPSVSKPAMRVPIAMDMSKGDNDFAPSLEQVKNGALSVFAASMIFLTPGPAFVDPAFAAAPAPAAATTTKEVSKKAEKPKAVDPLAAEKANVEAAKAKVAAAGVTESKAKKALADANSVYKKAEDASTAADKKCLEKKKALISANDKLADAKAKEGASGNMNALKEVESLASKVGTFALFPPLKCMSVLGSDTNC